MEARPPHHDWPNGTVYVNEPSSGYSGPSQFKVYKDNVYGTFMLYPSQ